MVSGEDRAARGRPTEAPRYSRAQRGLAAGERWQPAAVLLSAAARGTGSPLSTAAAAAAGEPRSASRAAQPGGERSARGMGTGAGPPEEARGAAEGSAAPAARIPALAALAARWPRWAGGWREAAVASGPRRSSARPATRARQAAL